MPHVVAPVRKAILRAHAQRAVRNGRAWAYSATDATELARGHGHCSRRPRRKRMPASTSHVIGIHTAQTASSTAARPLAGVFETLSEQHRQALELLRNACTPQPAPKR